MTSIDSKEYSLFTGCLIPSKYPFIEKASRLVFEKLGLKIRDIDEAGCCPNQMAIQSSDKKLWYTIAARNLALAEKNDCDILSLCNGCYDTLKTVNSKLKTDDRFREKINETLAEFGLEYRGTIDVKHVIQVLRDDVGLNAIEKEIINSLSHMKFSPFVGCHVKRPMDHMGFDDPEEPHYLRDLLKVTGARAVGYTEEHSCCGGGLSIGREHDAVPYARRVMRSISEAGASGLVVNCPYCFAQFFRSEKKINDIYPDKLQLPVFYITQLLGLGMGFSEEELGLGKHYDESAGNEETVVREILAGEQPVEVYNDEVTCEQLEICSSCLACCDDCSTAMATSEYNPKGILELVVNGHIKEAINRKDIWFCMNCHECSQHCPQNFGMVKLIVRLKNLAVASGIKPKVVEHRLTELANSGYSFPPDNESRAALGLCERISPKADEFRKIINDMRS